MSKRKKQIGVRHFIDVWQTSRSIGEVATRLQISEAYAHTKASWYRTKKDIPLKVFPRKKIGGRRGFDWAELRSFATELVRTEEGE